MCLSKIQPVSQRPLKQARGLILTGCNYFSGIVDEETPTFITGRDSKRLINRNQMAPKIGFAIGQPELPTDTFTVGFHGLAR